MKAVECQIWGSRGCNVPTKLHRVTAQKTVILVTGGN
jgi:hypothetical protein